MIIKRNNNWPHGHANNRIHHHDSGVHEPPMSLVSHFIPSRIQEIVTIDLFNIDSHHLVRTRKFKRWRIFGAFSPHQKPLDGAHHLYSSSRLGIFSQLR